MAEVAQAVPLSTPTTSRAPMTWRPVWIVAAVVAVVHLAVAARYGWHRDEFYYVIAGRHLAWGYVDQPPLAPLLARLAADLPGGVLPLRVLAIAAQVGCVLLTALLAAEFGGRRRAQLVAAGAVAACPAFVAGSLLFGTTVLDQVAWLAVLVLVARALRLGTTRAWLLAGGTAGLGLESKDTIAVLLLGIAVGLLLLRRDALRTPGPWLAGGLALVLAAPNLVWDGLHGWPNLAMAHSLSAEQGGPLGSLTQVPVLALLLAGPPLIVVWVSGVRWLGSVAGRHHRWLLVVAAVAIVAFTAGGGKSYYAAPALAGLFAAGAVWIEQLATAPGRLQLPVTLTVSGLVAVLVGLPVLPVSAAGIQHAVNPQPLETYGWPQFVDQVRRAEATLPPGTPIFTSNYGEAGALTILGPASGVHAPVFSGHNNYTYWGPPPGSPATVLCVGEWDARYLHRFWAQVREIAPITLPGGVRNEETDGAAIFVCQQPHGTWAQLWPGLRHFD